jgi:hypothetical protein
MVRVGVQASVNPKAETVDELQARRKHLHMGMLNLAQEDLSLTLQAANDDYKVRPPPPPPFSVPSRYYGCGPLGIIWPYIVNLFVDILTLPSPEENAGISWREDLQWWQHPVTFAADYPFNESFWYELCCAQYDISHLFVVMSHHRMIGITITVFILPRPVLLFPHLVHVPNSCWSHSTIITITGFAFGVAMLYIPVTCRQLG